MNWNETFENLNQMIGMTLHSISGKSDINILDIYGDQIDLSTPKGQKTRTIKELQRIVKKLDLLTPIHVDSILLGSGSSRNQPETILANMPDVEYLYLNECKHIVWVGHKTHKLGTLKPLDDFNSSQMRTRYKGRGPVTGKTASSIIILTNDVKISGELATAITQTNEPQILPGGGYLFSSEIQDVTIIPKMEQSIPTFEILPVARVVDKSETIQKILKIFPDAKIEQKANINLIYLPNGTKLIIE